MGKNFLDFFGTLPSASRNTKAVWDCIDSRVISSDRQPMKTMLLNNYKYKKCLPNSLIDSARAILELAAHLKTKVRQQLSGQLLWSPVQLLVRLESCSQPLVGQSVTYTISPAMSLTIVCLFL